MRVKVIINPWSRRGRTNQQKEIIQTLGQPYGGLDVVYTNRPGHGQELAQIAADEGYDVVAAAGGDGTVHEVVNGLMQSRRTNVRFGVLPVGSGNDFAYAIGVPMTNLAAAVQRLFLGQPRAVDLGRIEDDRGRYKYFQNNFGVGFDATVTIATESITRVQGFLMYFLATLRTIAFYYQTPYFEMRFDDEEVAQKVLFMAVGVGPRGGGGFLLTPDARFDDNLLDSCLVNPVGRLTMVMMLPKTLKGTHVTSKHVTMRKSRRIVIKSDQPMPIHVDGEVFAYPRDNVRHVTLTSVPAAIQVMV